MAWPTSAHIYPCFMSCSQHYLYHSLLFILVVCSYTQCYPNSPLKPASENMLSARLHPEVVHDALVAVSTPLDVQAREAAMSSHPDRAFATYISDGLWSGFRIGFKPNSPLKPASENMLSARLHPEVVSNYLLKELALGRMLSPSSRHLLSHLYLYALIDLE